ncbi:MAG: hypothetical protein COC05_04100 [Gammaproteobacteria bacterium]|nr:MAG: hypothetical protein COC05_04100 [Gammaproteobacteria bacterium]
MKQYQHLNKEERFYIWNALRTGSSQKDVSATLGRQEGKLVVKFIENKYALEIKVPFKSVSKEPSLKNFAFEIDSRFGAIITEDYFIIPNTNNLLATIIFRVKLPDYEWINGENIRVDIISK